MTEKILIVGEDKLTQQTLSAMLLKEGYEVSSVTDVQSALSILESENISAALIALDLLDMSSAKVLRKTKEISPDTKIILLAENGSMETVIEAIRHDAHDYILAPIGHEEILASITNALAELDKEKRIRTLVQQIEDALQELKDLLGYTGKPKTSQRVISLPDGVSLDLPRREMWRGAEKERLTPTEAQLLEIFVTNWGRVLSNEELAFLIQGFEVSGDEAPEILRPLISRLRRKLDSFPEGKKWISSVRGVGYVFDADMPG
ncbi:MAG: response regulator transcription factor [Candidatus Brocadiales bacterium]|nr:response regulator transcription factor [Candidatus Brocadiales bacterium]